MAEITLDALNRAAAQPEETVREAERKYDANVQELAGTAIRSGGVSVVLIAGPSASGKTTTANLVADAVRKRGHDAQVISLDDFYLDHDDPDYPRLANGERNMECAEALNCGKITECIRRILSGEPYEVPRYDFLRSASVEAPTVYPGRTDGCVIIEGLHALNPKLTGGIRNDRLIKAFISLSTNITDGNGERVLSGKKLRFIRRSVRDRIYRGASADVTLRLWKTVLDGENKYLYPYRDLADFHFDTFHLFEPGVMAKHFLRTVTETSKDDPYMQAVLRAAERFAPIDDALIPPTSMIREFLPDGSENQEN